MTEKIPLSKDPLGLSQNWGIDEHDQTHIAALIGLQNVLETSCLRQGIRRDQLLSELLRDLNHQRLIPLLAILPRGWRMAPAYLPERLRGIAALLGDGLLSPLLLAALADDLQHLIPPRESQQPNAIERWRQESIALEPGHDIALPNDLNSCQALANRQLPSTAGTTQHEKGKGACPPPLKERLAALGNALVWHNEGLAMIQNKSSQRMNKILAQVLNRLAANRLPAQWKPSEAFVFEGLPSGQSLIDLLINQGWQCRGRIRASVASFGLGASQPVESGGWRQIPLAVPYRTGLEDEHNQEILALLPHCSFEMELKPQKGDSFLLQYYQGIEGVNGWAAMNDLHRPWQNDRHNGTVAYPGEPFTGQRLSDAMEFTELMAAVHNLAASTDHLHLGGYGALGYCIDSTALLEHGLNGSSSLFPITLGGLWRERLRRSLETLLGQGFIINSSVADRYRWSLDTLPQDLCLQGSARKAARQRLVSTQPSHSPFELVRELNGETLK